MLLAIDAGNTNVVLAVHDGTEWRGRRRIATRADRTSDEYAVWLVTLFQYSGLKPTDIDCCVIGTVVPAAPCSTGASRAGWTGRARWAPTGCSVRWLHTGITAAR